MSYINENFALKDSGWSNAVDTIDIARHRWYYYKEGFSPQLVEKAIQHADLKNNEIILDPFNGSGTTTLTASLLGYRSVGIEVNPFTSFLSNVKLKNVDTKVLAKHSEIVLRGIEDKDQSPFIGFSTFSQKDGLEKWLFNNEVLNAFEGGWSTLESIPSDYKEIIKLALIASAMTNCNARRDGKCLRYRPTWKSNQFSKDSFNESFLQNLNFFIEDINSHQIKSTANVILGDSRRIINDNTIGSFKLCVTSPPYLNTFDYTDIYRPELFLGRFIRSQDELYELRLHTVRSHVQASWNKPMYNDFGFIYSEMIKKISEDKSKLMDNRIPMMIQAYFEDMFEVLKKLRAKVEKNGSLWLVISNSAYAGVEVPVDLIIGDIGTKAGWYLKEIGVLRYLNKRKTKHSPEVTKLRESVVIFSANK